VTDTKQANFYNITSLSPVLDLHALGQLLLVFRPFGVGVVLVSIGRVERALLGAARSARAFRSAPDRLLPCLLERRGHFRTAFELGRIFGRVIVVSVRIRGVRAILGVMAIIAFIRGRRRAVARGRAVTRAVVRAVTRGRAVARGRMVVVVVVLVGRGRTVGGSIVVPTLGVAAARGRPAVVGITASELVRAAFKVVNAFFLVRAAIDVVRAAFDL